MTLQKALLLMSIGIAAAAQEIPLDTSVLPKTECEIRVVDTFGEPLENSEVYVDGSEAKREDSRHFIALKRGEQKVRGTANGFGSYMGVIHVIESRQLFLVCLRLGSLWDRPPHRVVFELSAPPETVRDCSTLVVLPLYCASCRPATFHQLYQGRYVFEDLEPGAYVFTVLGKNRRTCVSAAVEAAEEAAEEPDAQIRLSIPN